MNFSQLARQLNKLRELGWKIGIISWTAKHGSDEYNAAVEVAKRAWLAKHLPSVTWDAIKVVRYGTNKWETCGGGILFDDEEGNRNAWGDKAYSPEMIMTVLKALQK